MPHELLSYRDVRSDGKSGHGAWPVVIPLMIALFEVLWALSVERWAARSFLRGLLPAIAELAAFTAWPLGIVGCLLGVCYAVEDLRRRINPPLAQLALMLNILVIVGIAIRILIAI